MKSESKIFNYPLPLTTLVNRFTNKLVKISIFACLLLIGLQSSGLTQELTSDFVLNQSIKFHDPGSKWSQTRLEIHIQEPRIQNPLRFSKLILDISDGSFSLSRDSEIGEIERIITSEGEPIVRVNGSTDFNEEVREEYRLNSSRNAGYRMFYQLLYGFPMSFKGEIMGAISKPSKEVMFSKEYIVLDFNLKESIISDTWRVYFSGENFSVEALKFIHDDPDQEDELILFDGSYSWDGITIPRYRHWYLSESREYLGSDIIVKELE